MSKLEWTAQLLTGQRSIDLQHQELIEMINDLDNELTTKAPAVQIHTTLQHLTNYAIFHFGHEEALMRRHGISGAHAETHLRQHAEFAECVAQSMASLASSATDLAAPTQAVAALLTFLKGWLPQHIQGTDIALVGLLRDSKR